MQDVRIASRGTCKGSGFTCTPETSSVTSSTPASSAFTRVALAISQRVDRVPSAGRRSRPAEGGAGTNGATSAQAARATTRAKLGRTGCIASCSACSHRHACVFATRPFNRCLCFVPTRALPPPGWVVAARASAREQLDNPIFRGSFLVLTYACRRRRQQSS